jgi:muramoyltetrapeptide carboxypeptidase
MIFSSLQNKGYQVQVVAPAGATVSDTMQKIKKVLPSNFFFRPSDYHSWFFHSNSDEKRGEELVSALQGPCKVIFALRGGYGCARIFEQVAAALPQLKTPKVLVGYSDITAVHLFLQNLGWPTIHGPILLEVFSGKKSAKNSQLLEALLSGQKKEICYSNIKPINLLAQQTLEVKGPLIGGNLTLVQNSLGTPWEIQTQDRILFLEDVNVLAYQLDRSLLHLCQAGVFKKAKALVLGSFSPSSEEILTTLRRFCGKIDIPVFQCNFIGHGVENYPVILNEMTEIKRAEGQMTRAVTKASEGLTLFSLKQSCDFLRKTLGFGDAKK